MIWLKSSLFRASFVGGLIVGSVGMAGAAEISVCPDPADDCDYTTIQAGINAAGLNDTVLVGTPGRTEADVFYENILMKDGVTLASEGSDTDVDYEDTLGGLTSYTDGAGDSVPNIIKKPERATLTVIHGSGDVPVVIFPAVSDAVLDGFIIENVDGTADQEIGLIAVNDCSPTIQNNIIRDNQGPMYNGGIHIVGGATSATPLIQNNVIHYVNGPGVAVRSQGYPTIKDNEIFTTPPAGPGFAPGVGLKDDASAIIENNHLFENGGGGVGSVIFGITNSGNPLVIKGNNRIHHNRGDNNENFAGGVVIYAQAGDALADEIDIVVGGPNAGDGNEIYANMVGVRVDINGTDVHRIRSADIQNNNIHNNRKPGLHMSDLTTMTVKNNIADGNRVGLRFNYIDTAVIEHNSF